MKWSVVLPLVQLRDYSQHCTFWELLRKLAAVWGFLNPKLVWQMQKWHKMTTFALDWSKFWSPLSDRSVFFKPPQVWCVTSRGASLFNHPRLLSIFPFFTAEICICSWESSTWNYTFAGWFNRFRCFIPSFFAEPKKNVQSPFCHRFTYFCCLNDYKIPTNNLPHPTLRWMLPGPWLCSALRGDAWRRKKREQIWFVILMVEEWWW